MLGIIWEENEKKRGWRSNLDPKFTNRSCERWRLYGVPETETETKLLRRGSMAHQTRFKLSNLLEREIYFISSNLDPQKLHSFLTLRWSAVNWDGCRTTRNRIWGRRKAALINTHNTSLEILFQWNLTRVEHKVRTVTQRECPTHMMLLV